jgi:hypothetical protein
LLNATTTSDGGLQPNREQTPITRLAWKLSQALAPLEDEAARRNEIATVFRQGAGFTRLVEAYHDELPRRGPDSKDARFLFVIDQFEELFHPNNQANPDAQQLIEAVIDHFFNPHERCFVVMTMRSEHLADCAAYLELPDAINKSLYLVRRLNDQELRDAIVGPAKYYLRLLQRGNDESGTTALPSDVVFEERVIVRLMEDAASIAGDADHLPLLQHVLARVWDAARYRENASPNGVPGLMSWVDLEHAVAPSAERPSGWLREHDGINTLRNSLENWAEFTYRQRSPEEQAQIDVVLTSLAFKDPNNGLYFQQRVDVDDPRLLPGIVAPRERLRALFERGFLDTVNYMFWDDENTDRVTLKVSHEAFIRGWDHFRKLIDLEADRFDEFVAVLRKCALWKVEHRPELLLEASELARVENARLRTVFEVDDERKAWFHVLLQHRDGRRLAAIEPVVDQFIAASRARVEVIDREKRAAVERERQAREAEGRAVEEARETKRQQEIARREHEARRKQDDADKMRLRAEAERADALSKRNLWAASMAGVVAVVGLLVAAFAAFIQSPAMERIADFTEARTKAERRSDTVKDPGAGLRELRNLVAAARLVESAKRGRPIGGLSANGILDTIAFLPPVTSIRRLLASTSSEPVVNGYLRKLLTTTVWSSDTDPAAVPSELMLRGSRHELACGGKAARGGVSRDGSLLLGLDPEHGIFTPALDNDAELTFYDATFRGGQCTAEKIVWSVPRYLNPEVLFDAQLKYLAVVLFDTARGQDYVNLDEVVWEPNQGSAALSAQKVNLVAVVPDPPKEQRQLSAAGLVREEILKNRDGREKVPQIKMVTTWRAEAGIEVSVAGRAWRVISDRAVPIKPLPDQRAAEWSTLNATEPNSACHRLETDLKEYAPSGGDRRMFQDRGECFDIQRGGPGSGGPDRDANPNPADGQRSAREQLLISVYNAPLPETWADLKNNLPTPIANFVFASLPAGEDKWLIGRRGGPRDQWIALEQPLGELLIAPWGTGALGRLGEQVPGVSPSPMPTQTRSASARGAR